jgi:hypothetical protein
MRVPYGGHQSRVLPSVDRIIAAVHDVLYL